MNATERAAVTRTCLSRIGRYKWIEIKTRRIASGPPTAGNPHLQYVSAGQWWARALVGEKVVAYEKPTPTLAIECVMQGVA